MRALVQQKTQPAIFANYKKTVVSEVQTNRSIENARVVCHIGILYHANFWTVFFCLFGV